jgi:2-oxo-4-hydroxy-4-carboxy-5-ureidoimidazoline decarboxylase
VTLFFHDRPSMMGRDRFMAVFGGVWENSPWIAKAIISAGLSPSHDEVEGLHRAMCTVVRASEPEIRLTLIKAHPDLAGRLALAGKLTAESTSEQASAGLDRLSPEELQQFTTLNDAYKAKFGFPFIIAVRGLTKGAILESFKQRLSNDRDAEMAEAHRQIEKIVLIRLTQIAMD